MVYSDESGVGSKRSEPLVVVTGILISPDKDWDAIESKLSAIRHDARKQKLLYNDRELKGSYLYGAARRNVDGAGALLKRILEIPKKHPVLIYYGAIDRKGYENYRGLLRIMEREKQASAEDAAFDSCLARVDAAARNIHPDERILWIADRKSDPTKEKQTRKGLAGRAI